MKRKKSGATTLSLRPLNFREAVADILKIKPEPKVDKKKNRKKKQ